MACPTSWRLVECIGSLLCVPQQIGVRDRHGHLADERLQQPLLVRCNCLGRRAAVTGFQCTNDPFATGLGVHDLDRHKNPDQFFVIETSPHALIEALILADHYFGLAGAHGNRLNIVGRQRVSGHI